MGQLTETLKVDSPDDTEVHRLREYVAKWQGDSNLKARALGLLTMLGTKPASIALKKAEAEGIINKDHRRAWRKIRPYLAHGGIIKDPFDPVFWNTRNLLIDMSYKLIFKLIGYQGPPPILLSHDQLL